MAYDMNQQITDLEYKIRIYNHEYYDLHNPSISDAEYDAYYEHLSRISPNSPVLSEKSQSFDQDFLHTIPMGSLSKCKTVHDLYEKFKGKRVTITPKLDGASLTNHYGDGKLAVSVTRGRTETQKGKVITANVETIPSIPHTIGFQDHIEIRGEAVIKTSDWISISHLFSNARNAASGGLQCQDPNDTKNRKLTFFAYKVLKADPFFTHVETLKFLEANGFTVPPYEVVDVTSEEVLQAAVDRWGDFRKTLDYVTDGIVIRINDEREYEAMGISSNCWVGGAAYKYETEKAETKIVDIPWETGRLGYVTPVAVFDPVNLGGATVTRCTLNNPTWMVEHGNPTIGSVIIVEKCGDVIPGLSLVLTPGSGNTNQPSKCPSCGTDLIFETNSKGEQGVRLRCPNSKGCPLQFRDNVLNALRKLEIKGLAETTLDKIIDAGFVKEPWEIFDLDLYKLICAGFGKRQSEIIQEALKDIGAKPSHILAAMGLEGWGRQMFEKLQKSPAFPDERLMAGDFLFDELCTVDGIGPSRARTLADAFAPGAYGHTFLDEMKKRVSVTKQVQAAIPQTGATGKSFLITGTLSKGRSLVESDIIAAGGRIASSVSKKLDYLVVGIEAGGKLDKAQALGVKTISEDELKDILK
jgi:DNA ligase (NAD+)